MMQSEQVGRQDAVAERSGTTLSLDSIVGKATAIWNIEVPIGGNTISVGQIITALLVLVIGIVVAKLISRRVGKRILPRMRVERGAAAALQSILYYILVLVVLMSALQVAEVPLTIFTIFGGALALGIGFGSQNIVSNFISGLIVLIERPVKVGQMIEIDGRVGVVENIGPRATLIEGYNGVAYLVPNSMFLEQTVTNWEFIHGRYRCVVAVGVAYGAPTDRARDLLLEAAGKTDRALAEPPPEVLFMEFGDNALHFELHFWAEPKSKLERFQIESDVRFQVDALFREADIVIAFPQRDIHIDSSRPIEVRVANA